MKDRATQAFTILDSAISSLYNLFGQRIVTVDRDDTVVLFQPNNRIITHSSHSPTRGAANARYLAKLTLSIFEQRDLLAPLQERFDQSLDDYNATRENQS